MHIALRIQALIFAAIIFQSCSRSFKTTYLWRNQTVAILPFDTQGLLDEIPRNINLEELRALEIKEARILQQDLYRYFLRAMAANEYPTTFMQTVNTTNDILAENQLSVDDLRSMRSDEIADLLDVDAVISGYISGNTSRVVGSGLFNRALDSDKRVKVLFSLYKRNARGPSWTYDKSSTGTANETAADVGRRLMREAPKTFPF